MMDEHYDISVGKWVSVDIGTSSYGPVVRYEEVFSPNPQEVKVEEMPAVETMKRHRRTPAEMKEWRKQQKKLKERRRAKHGQKVQAKGEVVAVHD